MALQCDRQKTRATMLARHDAKRLAAGAEQEIIDMLRDQAKQPVSAPPHSHRLQAYFFIWIGCLQPAALEYIDIWQESVNGTGSLCIYYDSHFLLFNQFRTQFQAIYPVSDTTPIADLLRYQDAFYHQLGQGMKQGLSFDQALIEVSAKHSQAAALRLQLARQQARQQIALLQQRYTMRDIRQEAGLFADAFFERIYTMELTLRGNAAAAADILRLLLLYRRGGVYVDVDTLPSLNSVYGPLSDQANANIQQVVRADFFLRRRRTLRGLPDNAPATDDIYQRYLHEQQPHLLSSILHRVAQWDGSPLPAPRIHVFENLLVMAAMPTPGEFNNNLLAALPHSKLVRLVLREIKRRYQFIFRYGLDRQASVDLPPAHYLTRLRDYRLDTLNGADNVTLFLSGPVMLLEVVLGVAYDLLGLNRSVSPLALSYTLQRDELAMACREQTGYTPEHMRSSWM